MNYMMILENGTYLVELNKMVAISDLESMLDSLINLLKQYGVDDEEIIETLRNDTGLKIRIEEK